jgi:urease subunit gamma/beta
MDSGRRVLSADQLMRGVASMLDEVQVEATFPDGTKLVTIHDPIAHAPADGSVVPGEVLAGEGTITLFAGAELVTLSIANTGDRPVQVGSHFHLAEANPALRMDRAAARGRRLAIPAGTSVRFEPGIERQVDTVPFTGHRIIRGFRDEVAGPLDSKGEP